MDPEYYTVGHDSLALPELAGKADAGIQQRHRSSRHGRVPISALKCIGHSEEFRQKAECHLGQCQPFEGDQEPFRHEGGRMDSQAARQGRHLRLQTLGSGARQRSGALLERTHTAHDGWASRSQVYSQTSSTDFDGRDYANVQARPRSAAIYRQRALQTAPYPAFRGSGRDDREEPLDVRDFNRSRRTSHDESLQWIVGAEEARSLQHTGWSNELGSLRGLQEESYTDSPLSLPDDVEPYMLYPQHEYPEPFERANPLPRSSDNELRYHQRHRSLQSQPFSLQSYTGQLHNPLHTTASPSPRFEHEDTFGDSTPEGAMLSAKKKGFASFPVRPGSARSRHSTPLGYKSTYDYTIPSGKERFTDTGMLHVSETGGSTPEVTSRQSVKSASSSHTHPRQYSRLAAIQQVIFRHSCHVRHSFCALSHPQVADSSVVILCCFQSRSQ